MSQAVAGLVYHGREAEIGPDIIGVREPRRIIHDGVEGIRRRPAPHPGFRGTSIGCTHIAYFALTRWNKYGTYDSNDGVADACLSRPDFAGPGVRNHQPVGFGVVDPEAGVRPSPFYIKPICDRR